MLTYSVLPFEVAYICDTEFIMNHYNNDHIIVSFLHVR